MAEPARPLIRKNDDKSLPALVTELWELVVAYLKQETLDPLKGLLKFVGLGVLGAVVLAMGLVILSLAVLRFLQIETGTHLTGNWSWVPYIGTLIFDGLLAAIAVSRISAGAKKRAAG